MSPGVKSSHGDRYEQSGYRLFQRASVCRAGRFESLEGAALQGRRTHQARAHLLRIRNRDRILLILLSRPTLVPFPLRPIPIFFRASTLPTPAFPIGVCDTSNLIVGTSYGFVFRPLAVQAASAALSTGMGHVQGEPSFISGSKDHAKGFSGHACFG